MEKRWIGGALVLVVLLALGLWIGSSMENLHRPVVCDLEQAAQAALTGDMANAQRYMSRAGSIWSQHRGLTAALVDHSPMEEIDSIFAQLKSYGAADDWASFAAWCSRAASLVSAIGEINQFTWKNLL